MSVLCHIMLLTTATINRWPARCHRMTSHTTLSGQTPDTGGNKSLRVTPCFYQHTLQREKEAVLGGKRTNGGRTCEVGVFLPNRDLISEPEHTVCEDATRQGAAPLLPVGRLAL